MLQKIKAVIFDLDGVLIDAKDWHFEALNRALLLFGTQISRYDHLITYDGLPTRRKLEMLSIESGFPTGLHEFINELKQHYTMEMIYSKCHPRFNHKYALSRLKTNCIKLAVCSNAVKDTVEMMLKKSGLIQYVDFYLSNEDVKFAKPDPEIYNCAIKKLGIKPEECLILEDNRNGIMAAKHAGAHVMQISTVDDVNFENIYEQINIINKGISL
ncbi:MAG: HAD-superfamily hydrolase, subfamily variant 3 [Burkholderiales bacterium]|jgi:beta-phosphoglucomutase-like phosphatase (HAD superfamily)|nr:HAD-superfamily hydrolase, subfamily variant 3 [Burkholderiales bacterium]